MNQFPPASMPRTTVPSVFGGVVRQLRRDRRLSQEEFAAAIGLTPSVWSRMERGETSVGIEQVFAVAGVLRTSPTDLMNRTERALSALRSGGYQVDPGRLSPTSAGAAFLAGAALTALIAIALKDG